MKDHYGNELVVGDWVKYRSKYEDKNAVQIVEMVHGLVKVRDNERNNTWRGSTTIRAARVFIKLEPEELI